MASFKDISDATQGSLFRQTRSYNGMNSKSLENSAVKFDLTWITRDLINWNHSYATIIDDLVSYLYSIRCDKVLEIVDERTRYIPEQIAIFFNSEDASRISRVKLYAINDVGERHFFGWDKYGGDEIKLPRWMELHATIQARKRDTMEPDLYYYDVPKISQFGESADHEQQMLNTGGASDDVFFGQEIDLRWLTQGYVTHINVRNYDMCRPDADATPGHRKLPSVWFDVDPSASKMHSVSEWYGTVGLISVTFWKDQVLIGYGQNVLNYKTPYQDAWYADIKLPQWMIRTARELLLGDNFGPLLGLTESARWDQPSLGGDFHHNHDQDLSWVRRDDVLSSDYLDNFAYAGTYRKVPCAVFTLKDGVASEHDMYYRTIVVGFFRGDILINYGPVANYRAKNMAKEFVDIKIPNWMKYSAKKIIMDKCDTCNPIALFEPLV